MASPWISADVVELLRRLGRCEPQRTTDRLDALFEIYQMRDKLTRDDRETLAVTLSEILAGKRREMFDDAMGRALNTLLPVGGLFGLMIGMLLSSALSFYRSWAQNLAILVVVTIFGAIASSIVLGPLVGAAMLARSRKANDRVRAATALTLGTLQSRAGLAALARACADRVEEVRENALSAIAAQVQPLLRRDAQPLTSEESLALANSVVRVTPELAGLILEVLEKIGATSALQPLQSLVSPTSSPHEIIWFPLLKTVDTLRRRKLEEDRRQVLLRPSAPEADEALLRIPHSSYVSEPDRLLHVVDEDCPPSISLSQSEQT